MGLIVDRLLGQQEVVIKALDDYLGDTVGVSGATILGDGQVVLIVDTAKIM
jgi:two-component system chemotaxis sensor kinase CheA